MNIKLGISLKFFMILLLQVSAQDLSVSSLNNIRVVGHGLFSRTCTYSGNDTRFLRLEWLLNGTVLPLGMGDNPSRLVIQPPTMAHSGEYSCSAVFNSINPRINISAGSLTVFNAADTIRAPATQFVVVNDSITLECSTTIQRAFTTLSYPNSSLASKVITMAGLEDQGQYNCHIFEEQTDAEIYTSTVMLEVIVPPTILTRPQVSNHYGNEPVNFTVTFLSSNQHNTEVLWLRDNMFIESGIETRQTQTAGTTSLVIPQLTRADKGRYTIRISNNNTLITERKRSVDFSFDVTVIVPPTAPTLSVELTNNTLSVSWRLTNMTADAGPDTLQLNVENHPESPIRIDLGTESTLLQAEPGLDYNISLCAYNIDGSAKSSYRYSSVPPSAPLVTMSSALRVNDTAFNLTVEVAYTGAGTGNLQLVDIMFRENGTNDWRQISSLNLTPSNSRRNWHGVALNRSFSQLKEVEFSFRVQNRLNLTVSRKIINTIVVPGPPHSIVLISTTSNSLTLQAQLSTIGTFPILSAHLNITSPDHTSSVYEVREGLLPGGVVEFTVRGLSPATSYTVMVYVTNAAGRGPVSEKKTFITGSAELILPLWAILIIAIIGISIAVIVLLFVVIGCCYGRHNHKINLASSPSHYRSDRPGPLGSDSVDSLRREQRYVDCQKTANGEFFLSPPPQGQLTLTLPHMGSTSPSSHGYTKAAYLKDNLSDSETSERSSKYNHFNFRHSPVPPSNFGQSPAQFFSPSSLALSTHYTPSVPPSTLYNFVDSPAAPSSLINYGGELSRSMPVLEDRDLSPTMPPDCATDV